MGAEQRVRYLVIEQYAHRRLARPGHRVTVFETAEEADVEFRGLKRRSTAAAQVIRVDPTGRLTTLRSSP